MSVLFSAANAASEQATETSDATLLWITEILGRLSSDVVERLVAGFAAVSR